MGRLQTQLISKKFDSFPSKKISSCQLNWKSCFRTLRILKDHLLKVNILVFLQQSLSLVVEVLIVSQ